MADLIHLLAIYVHAHQTGNSVPPHIDAAARAALDAQPPAPAPAPAAVPVAVSEQLPQAKDCRFNPGAVIGSCWCWSPPAVAGGIGCWSFKPLDWAEDATHWLPAHAIPQPPQGGEVQPAATPDTRSPECVAAWPDCYDGGFNPRCCRFPKSCSCEVKQPSQGEEV